MSPARNALAQLSQLVVRATNATTNLTAPTPANATKSATPSIGAFATGLNGVDLVQNNTFKIMMWWSLGGLALLILAARMWERGSKHLRHQAALGVPGEHMTFWSRNTSDWWKIKKHILYAPLWKKRHNREIRISSAVNIGTLPSRLHFILLLLYVASNIFYCAYLDYGRSDKYSLVAELRGRSGSMAIANMIPLVILAGRNNPLIPLLQISFDTYNLIHRWMGRIVVVEIVAHTIAWAYVKHAAVGWSGLEKTLATDPFSSYGFVGTVAVLLILFTSPSPLRHAFYETFLNVHIILVAILLVVVWFHVYLGDLPQKGWINAIIVLWIVERVARFVRIVCYNYKNRSWTQATVIALPGEATRVTMHLPRYVDINPGTHAYLRFATLNAWESHPFSIAWVQHQIVYLPTSPNASKAESQEPQQKRIDKSKSTTDVSFIIQAQTGMTRRLFKAATAHAHSVPRLTLRAAFEGPYAGHHSLDSYGHAVLFAGSSGITHQLHYVRHLIQGFNEGVLVARQVLLVWIIRDPEAMEWVREWMDEILHMPGRREIFRIKIFITRPKTTVETQSKSKGVQLFPGRPNIRHLLKDEVKSQTGAMCVTVCGPGALADSVREAAREVQDEGVVDFIEESFTW